jgi:ribosomal protein S9
MPTDRISGSQTNEITISNLVSPTDNAKSVFLRATYEGSAYQSESGAITAGIARSTGNGVNEPLDTSAANYHSKSNNFYHNSTS